MRGLLTSGPGVAIIHRAVKHVSRVVALEGAMQRRLEELAWAWLNAAACSGAAKRAFK